MRAPPRGLVSLVVMLALVCDHADAQQSASESKEATPKSGEEESVSASFLPVPMFITEPAIGEGLGGGIIYFHKQPPAPPKILTGDELRKTARRKKAPPTATGIFAAETNKDTAAVGIGHARSINNDKYRVIGVLADARINAETFVSDLPFSFELDGNLFMASFKRRFGESDMFLGFSVSALNADVDFRLGGIESPPVDLFDFELTTVGTAISLSYDARDDSMMPSSGQLVELTGSWYDEATGSDFDYTRLKLKARSFHELHERFVLGFRLDVTTAGGEPPFFAVPYVSMRGIPALRYQGDTAGAVEVEGRFNLSRRWAAIAFAGAGFTDTDRSAQETDDEIDATGVGIRYQAIKSQNVWVGIDFARGPEDNAWYIQIGHPW